MFGWGNQLDLDNNTIMNKEKLFRCVRFIKSLYLYPNGWLMKNSVYFIKATTDLPDLTLQLFLFVLKVMNAKIFVIASTRLGGFPDRD